MLHLIRRRKAMDQVKIGKFIADRRKEKGLTQMELADKLGITDRAVSKWECGRSMPDSSIMLELCHTLGISVNDLLTGEVIKMEDYKRKSEDLLTEMAKEKELADKRLLTLEYVIGIFSIIILLTAVFTAAFLPMQDWVRVVLIVSGFAIAIIGFGFAVMVEQIAGYYECRACKHRYVPTYPSALFAMHFGRTRYMKCPCCGRWSWNRKVIKKD